MDQFFTLLTLSQCLLLSSLALKPSPYRSVLFPLIASINLYLHSCAPTGDPSIDVGLSSATLSYLFIASDFIILTDVQRELRLVGQKEPISNSSFWCRLKWGLQLLFGPRGVGWAHEPILPSNPNYTRSRFITSQVLRIIAYMLLYDVASIVNRTNTIFVKGAPSFGQQPLLWRCLGLWAFVTSSHAYMVIHHSLLSIVAVAFRMSEPNDWPDLFGAWGDAYTVRKFWGRTWHQVLRRVLSSHGRYLTRRVFKFTTGSKSSSYLQLYTAFFISGVIHTSSQWEYGPLRFFVSQAVVITIEDAIIALASRIGFGKTSTYYKLLGYAWVWFWFVYSITPWLDTLTAFGLLENGLGFSVILGLHHGEWRPTR